LFEIDLKSNAKLLQKKNQEHRSLWPLWRSHRTFSCMCTFIKMMKFQMSGLISQTSGKKIGTIW